MSHRINLCRGLAYQMQRALQGLPPIPPRKWWVEVYGTRGWVLREARVTLQEARDAVSVRIKTGTAPTAVRLRPYAIMPHLWPTGQWQPYVGQVARR